MTMRWLGAAGLLALLAACGGGGSGASSGTAPADNDLGAHLSTTTLQLQLDVDAPAPTQTYLVSLLVDRLPPAGHYYYGEAHSSKAIAAVNDVARTSDYGVDFQLGFGQPGLLGIGTYDDTLTIDVCLDAGCTKPALGSPLTAHVILTIGHFAEQESDMPQVPVASSVALPHDIVDAAYSAALDAVVSVSGRPAPALNLFDLASGQTRSIALATAPTAVSLAPDGLHAAVGHDAAVSVVTLAAPGFAMSVQRFAVSQPVGEVLFDGHGRVFNFGNDHFNWNAIHTLDLASGVDTPGSNIAVYGVPHAVLHPSGDRFYFSNENVSPNDIFSISLLDPVPGTIVDSPYHGQYEMCGQVWVSPDGLRLFTACGNVFSSSPVASQDMLYAGALALTGPSGMDSLGYAALSLSVNAAGSQVALLEHSLFYCDPRLNLMASCHTHLSLYDAATLVRLSRYSLPPVAVGSSRFAQDGRYLFHRASGGLVMLSELRGAPDPAASIRLSLLP